MLPLHFPRWVSQWRRPAWAQQAGGEGLGGGAGAGGRGGVSVRSQRAPSRRGRLGVWPRRGGACPGAGIGGTRPRGLWPDLQGNLTLLHPERVQSAEGGRRGSTALATALHADPVRSVRSSLSFGAANGDKPGGIPELRGGCGGGGAWAPRPWARPPFSLGAAERRLGPDVSERLFLCAGLRGTASSRPVSRGPRGEEGARCLRPQMWP